MKNSEDKDPIWDLLNQASKREPSPFFSRNVIREVRKLESETSWAARFASLFRSPLAVTASVATVAIAAVAISIWNPNSSETAPPSVAEVEAPASETFDPADELEAVEYLGQLMAIADPGQLTDEALGDLFF